MIKQRIEEAINKQINAEFWSAYLYLSMACDMESKGFKGIANWFRVQYEEELSHAKIFINHVTARGGRVNLTAIADVPQNWESPREAFVKTLEHERVVTSLINDLYSLAEEEKDYATRQMLNWFVAEQVEEEDTAQEMIDNLNLIGQDGTGIYQFDRELATRTFVAPAILTDKE